MKKRVIIFGKFDIVHPGHISFIKHAQSLGQVTVVLESDQTIRGQKGYRTFYNNKIRQQNLARLGLDIYLHDQQTKEQILADLNPDIILLCQDQEFLLGMFKNTKSPQVVIHQLMNPGLFKSSRLRPVLENGQSAIYLIDKPKGDNSFKAVSVLRKILNIKKIGFAGTLDPLASGLLILASSRATRLLDWFHFLPKVYEADIIFGQTSETYDLESKPILNEKAKNFDRKYLESRLKKFLGKQKQQVPIYSATKVGGQKLHKLARRGEQVIAPFKTIEIYDLKIKKFKYPHLKLSVSCSAGTYIRSLVHDLGEVTGHGALLTDLRRLSIGDFSVKQALNLNQVTAENLADCVISPEQVIESLNQFFYQ